MSVEAISWALNLAPMPSDRGGKRNPACKAVLIGLANHAAPDGKEAFPSVRTLIRYTDLSERTVQTALDRLEGDGIIRPCDPAVVAAKIKRADRRPRGWDLAMHLVRDDLDEEELAVLERQFPGLTARVAAMGAADSSGPGDSDDGVQPLHPAGERPVDNVTHGARRLPPVPPAGGNCRGNGVQPPRERGAVGRLAPMAAAAVAAGWEPAALAAFVGANTAGVRSPAAVLAARLSPAELPGPPGRGCTRPPWCGACDEATRMLGYDGDAPRPCPRCKPAASRGMRAPHRRPAVTRCPCDLTHPAGWVAAEPGGNRNAGPFWAACPAVEPRDSAALDAMARAQPELIAEAG